MPHGLPTHLPAAAVGVATGAPLPAPPPVPAAHGAVVAEAARQTGFGESPADGPPPEFPDVVRAPTLVVPEATMTFNGLHYTRIWQQRAPEAGREGGGLELEVPAIRLALTLTLTLTPAFTLTLTLTLTPG